MKTMDYVESLQGQIDALTRRVAKLEAAAKKPTAREPAAPEPPAAPECPLPPAGQ